MGSADIEVIHQFVDNSLDKLREIDMMRFPHSNMPLAMRDETQEAHNDWIPWKAIPSTVSDSEILELEQRINLHYPTLYVEFLKYKHFYELLPVKEITFFDHSIDEWKQKTLRYYFKAYLPAEIIEKGYIPFADYSDWGIVCFDTSMQSQSDYDCQIVMIDHELLFNKPVPKEVLYPSFAEMMRSLLEEQNNPTESEEE